ncbi:SufD family Fe-S cluster assembly protein [Candidatus Nomurabacteria bacterium]|nr:SufD family Fe-S cluster assembly protein [Candidatus Nomurabacteria bacterium]
MTTETRKYGIGIANVIQRASYVSGFDVDVNSDGFEYEFFPMYQAGAIHKFAKFIKNNEHFYEEPKKFESRHFLYVGRDQKGSVDLKLLSKAVSSGYLLIAVDRDTHLTIHETVEATDICQLQVDVVVMAGATVEYSRCLRAVEAEQIETTHRGKVLASATLAWNEYYDTSDHIVAKTVSYLQQPGAQATIRSGIKTCGLGVVDIDHQAIHNGALTSSRIGCAGVAKDSSKIIYKSDIVIPRGSKKALGHQKADFLQLSAQSEVDAVPSLNVSCHDVQCSHGVSITKYKQEHIFYLTSRGMSEEEAKSLLEKGHLQQVLEKMPKCMLVIE